VTWLFVTLFVLGAAWLLLQLVTEVVGPGSMPLACPRCHYGGSSSFGGVASSWHIPIRGSVVKCRACHTHFREHPNGSLVEDRS
jgi:hypothetical protein